MKKEKRPLEHKFCVGLFIISLVMYGISLVTGLMPELNCSIDKICMYLGFSFFGFGLVVMNIMTIKTEK